MTRRLPPLRAENRNHSHAVDSAVGHDGNDVRPSAQKDGSSSDSASRSSRNSSRSSSSRSNGSSSSSSIGRSSSGSGSSSSSSSSSNRSSSSGRRGGCSSSSMRGFKRGPAWVRQSRPMHRTATHSFDKLSLLPARAPLLLLVLLLVVAAAGEYVGEARAASSHRSQSASYAHEQIGAAHKTAISRRSVHLSDAARSRQRWGGSEGSGGIGGHSMGSSEAGGSGGEGTGSSSGARDSDGGDELRSGCSCYILQNNMCCEHSQPVCVCRDVCYNGSALVGTFHASSSTSSFPASRRARRGHRGAVGPWSSPLDTSSDGGGEEEDKVASAEEEEIVPCSPHLESELRREFGPDERLLRLVECWQDTELYDKLLSRALDENHWGHSLGVRPRDWLRSRRQVVWRRGSTLLNPLPDEASNIAHMIGKVGALQLAARIPTLERAPFTRPFDLILLPRGRWLIKVMKRSGGADGWLPQVVRTFANIALEGGEGGGEEGGVGVTAEDVVGDADVMLAQGRLELEGKYERVSEEEPMCFQRVVFAACLKAVMYLGGEAMARQVQQRIASEHNIALQLRPAQGVGAAPSDERLKLLFISRQGASKGGRLRALTPKGRSALLKTMEELGFEVRLLDFAGLTFKQQFELCQWPDVILTLHGAGATNPASFARPATVLIELIPFPFMFELYGYMSVNSGLVYLMHMLTKGPTQPGDLDYADLVNGPLGSFACLSHRRCHSHYNDRRRIVLGREDLSEVRQLLELAKSIAQGVREHGPGAAAAQLRTRLEEERLCLATKRDRECRTNLLHWPSARPDECFLTQNCTREAVQPPVVTNYENL